MSAFSEWWDGFLANLMSIGHDVLDFITPMGKQFATELGKAGLAIVIAQVAQVQKDYAGGDTALAKKDMALNRILPALQEAGIKAGMNTINGAIEVAVSKMKAEA